MTRTRVLAALVMAPAAIAAIVLLSTPWLAALAALVLLMGLWEWLKLAGVEDTLPRIVLVGLNLALMVLLVWASRDASGLNPALFQIVTLLGALAWLLAPLWLWRPGFTAGDRPLARAFKLAAGTVAVIPAWAALCLLHSDNFANLAGQAGGEFSGAEQTRRRRERGARNHGWLVRRATLGATGAIRLIRRPDACGPWHDGR